MFQIAIAKKGGQHNSRIPLPTGRYFLNLSPNDLPPTRTPNNLRPPKSGNARRVNQDRTLNLETPSTVRTLTPVNQAKITNDLPPKSHDHKEGREVLDVHKASATSLSSTQSKASVVEANLNSNSNEMYVPTICVSK